MGRPTDTHIRVSIEEAPFLLNVLTDNARPWNRRLREELGQIVDPRKAFNAKRALMGFADEQTLEETK